MSIKPVPKPLSQEDGEKFLDTWQPDPLVPNVDGSKKKSHLIDLNIKIVDSKPGLNIIVDGVECSNFVTPNYLNLAENHKLEEVALKAVCKYGVGSCGPRAFYGTMDAHLQLEQDIADFLQVQASIVYSFGFTAIASAIPAYAKQTDIIFLDECCNFAIQQGVRTSRAEFRIFKHNDIEDLIRCIESVGNKKLKNHRSFIIVEGLYERTGRLSPLKKIIDVKKKYKIRLFLDESYSFGVLGQTGRGATEHHNVDIEDIDLIMGSLENAICAYGGFCAGTSYVVEHQRIAGSGYIFSASLPPFQVLVAIESLKIIKEHPEDLLNAQKCFKNAHDLLGGTSGLKCISDKISPIKHFIPNEYEDNVYSLFDQSCGVRKQLRFNTSYNDNTSNLSLSETLMLNKFFQSVNKLSKICDNALKKENIAITIAHYIEDEEFTHPLPSIKLMIPSIQNEDVLRHKMLSLKEQMSMFEKMS